MSNSDTLAEMPDKSFQITPAMIDAGVYAAKECCLAQHYSGSIASFGRGRRRSQERRPLIARWPDHCGVGQVQRDRDRR
jgi:hypothetical protein